jgi:hypothetical protein
MVSVPAMTRHSVSSSQEQLHAAALGSLSMVAVANPAKAEVMLDGSLLVNLALWRDRLVSM